MPGRFFDAWRLGDRIAHEIRRTVTQTDNLLFSAMTHNPQRPHIDAEAAKASQFGRTLVDGTFTFALMVAYRSATRRWATVRNCARSYSPQRRSQAAPTP
jgi:acyl dehydratase